jgi:hypothetical protein
MEPGRSLLCSQKPATGLYPEPIEFSSQPHTTFLYCFILFIPLSLRTEHRASTVPRHPRLLSQFLGSIRHFVGLLGGGISPAQGLYLHRTTQHRKTQSHIHAPSRIRSCDPNVRAAEDSTCLRPLGHWDRLPHSFKIRFNSILPTTRRPPTWFLPFRFSD